MFLALDSSTLTLSLALLEHADGGVRVIESFEEGPPKKQSQMLPGVIGELLARHGVRLEELQGIAIGLGPGSFTGLRIGLATVKALSYAARLEVVGVSSLAAVALEGPAGVELRPCAVARQNELYVGHYRREGEGVTSISPERALTPAELAEELRASLTLALSQRERDAQLALGPAISEYRSRLEALGVSARQLLDEPRFPHASAVAKLAHFSGRYDAQAIFALEPHYVRASEAERNPKFPPLPGPAPLARIKKEE
ncbi:MAG: tRNA (adenosine(37)-N6)-threonylcarbamoyltransferase complex dimerization subunit type 1 TsaB [Myxococcota bacterium]